MGMSREEIDRWKRDNPNEVLLRGRLNRTLTSEDTPYIISGALPKGTRVSQVSKMWTRDITWCGDCKDGIWVNFSSGSGVVQVVKDFIRIPQNAVDWMSDDVLEAGIAREISECQSVVAVKQVLHAIAYVKGSRKTYTAKELCDIIDEFTMGQSSSDYITQTYGLRKKIEDLFAEAFIASR